MPDFHIQFFFFLEYTFLLDHFTNSYKALLLSPHIELVPLKNYIETYIWNVLFSEEW